MKDMKHSIPSEGPHVIETPIKDAAGNVLGTLLRFLCQKCAHLWSPRSEADKRVPRVCPKCKSYRWNLPRTSPAGRKKAVV